MTIAIALYGFIGAATAISYLGYGRASAIPEDDEGSALLILVGAIIAGAIWPVSWTLSLLAARFDSLDD